MDSAKTKPVSSRYRQVLHEIIFEADTLPGKIFDVWLIVTILLSVIVVMLDSVTSIRQEHASLLYLLEWTFTVVFTIEYLLRLYCVGKPLRYAASFFGVVDLLAILPTYLSLILPGSQYFLVVRMLRIVRVFRVFKLAKYISEGQVLRRALYASRRKIGIFLYVVMILVVIIGALMYLIEGEAGGFTSIPRSIYWAVVTLTTVGYGDITPVTGLGQAMASLVMIIGYGIIAVPTGIVTAEMAIESARQVSTQACPECSAEGHDADARYCKYCGAKL